MKLRNPKRATSPGFIPKAERSKGSENSVVILGYILWRKIKKTRNIISRL